MRDHCGGGVWKPPKLADVICGQPLMRKIINNNKQCLSNTLNPRSCQYQTLVQSVKPHKNESLLICKTRSERLSVKEDYGLLWYRSTTRMIKISQLVTLTSYSPAMYNSCLIFCVALSNRHHHQHHHHHLESLVWRKCQSLSIFICMLDLGKLAKLHIILFNFHPLLTLINVRTFWNIIIIITIIIITIILSSSWLSLWLTCRMFVQRHFFAPTSSEKMWERVACNSIIMDFYFYFVFAFVGEGCLQ